MEVTGGLKIKFSVIFTWNKQKISRRMKWVQYLIAVNWSIDLKEDAKTDVEVAWSLSINWGIRSFWKANIWYCLSVKETSLTYLCTLTLRGIQNNITKLCYHCGQKWLLNCHSILIAKFNRINQITFNHRFLNLIFVAIQVIRSFLKTITTLNRRQHPLFTSNYQFYQCNEW